MRRLPEYGGRSLLITHSFLKEEDFNEIKTALVPGYFPNVDLYAIACNGIHVGFLESRKETIYYCRWLY